MRTPNAAALALRARRQAGEAIPQVPLVFMGLPVPQRWAVCGLPLVWGGFSWAPLDMAISDVSDQVGERSTLRFTLPAVQPAELALAAQDVEGAIVRVYLADVDPATGAVADALQVWYGLLDQPGWQDGQAAVAQFTARHILDWALEPRPRRYTHDDQLRLYPGDTSMNVDPLTDAAPLVWPAAAYWRQE